MPININNFSCAHLAAPKHLLIYEMGSLIWNKMKYTLALIKSKLIRIFI